MSKILWKNLLKCLPSAPLCLQHPFPQDDHQPSPPSTTTTTNNNSSSSSSSNNNTNTPPMSNEDSKSTSLAPSTSVFSSSNTSSFSDSDSETCSPVDFAAIFASQRFFFSSPGKSNSIIDTSEPLPPPLSSLNSPLSGGLAVKKYSPDPYQEFKHSMQEMIDARKLNHVRVDWEYLHELLSCYLTLNSKHTHKFIISAFSDIVISLLSSSSPESDNIWPEQK